MAAAPSAPNSEAGDGGWHLDKRVPIALIFAIVAQAAGMVWYASALSSRVDQHDRRIAKLEATDEEDRKNALLIMRDLGEIKAQVKILLDRFK
jgi:hypothetical protein